MPETRTYQGATLEELLPRIREELGAGAVITRRREGVTGGFAGFFGKRCVEVEAQAAAQVPAVPARSVFDAYDATRPVGDDEGPVIRTLVEQASPFADALDEAYAHQAVEAPAPAFEEIDLVPVSNGAVEVAARPVLAPGWAEIADELVSAGMPRSAVDSLVHDAETMLAPFEPDASPADLVRRMIARTVRVEHGWRTKRRTIALVGPAGSGKSLTAAKLAHAFAARSPLAVRLVSLEPGAAADRLAAMTAGLALDRRTAGSPEAAKAAVRAPGMDSVIVVDTPPVSAGDPAGIDRLGDLLAAMRPDETHLVAPAAYDARTLLRLHEALGDVCAVNRILISRIDEAPSAATAVGLSLTLRRPVSYISDGRTPAAGLHPAEPTRLAELVMP